MKLPDEIISQAMLGMDQSAADLPQLDTALGDLLARFDEDRPAARLLAMVGGLALQQQAGWQVPRDRRALPDACPPDDTRPCRPRAMRYLLVMLQGHYPQAIAEWLTEVARSGQRAPEEALPLLLDAGRHRADLRPLIWPVLGQRGPWLAQAARGSRAWTWANLDRADQTWQTGSPEERLTLIETLRHRQPDRAREWVAEVWADENADLREKLLARLETGLSLADEPFLEAALDDRGRGARKTAANLLARLPASRFVERMRHRATPVLDLSKTRLTRQTRLEISSEISFDDSMARDGLESATPTFHADMPPSLWYLHQVLGYIPPTHWGNLWQLTPAALLEAARRSKIPLDFETIWGWAAYRAGDSDFAAMLLQAALDRLGGTLVESLATVLAVDQLEVIAINWLVGHGAGFRSNHPAAPLLRAYPGRWSQALTNAFLTSLNRYLRGGAVRPDPTTRSILLDFACNFPPDMQAEVMRTLTTDTSAKNVWEDMLDEVRLLLEFRAEMLEAIGEN